jgi:hypothetical protein
MENYSKMPKNANVKKSLKWKAQKTSFKKIFKFDLTLIF